MGYWLLRLFFVVLVVMLIPLAVIHRGKSPANVISNWACDEEITVTTGYGPTLSDLFCLWTGSRAHYVSLTFPAEQESTGTIA